jgi:L,D-peptidoglycan transpeptidase YkuD (ErfK/YbiS/YcfS/YnhG family)
MAWPAWSSRGTVPVPHINIGTPTAGCVTLPVGELLKILRWLNPAGSPRITRRA